MKVALSYKYFDGSVTSNDGKPYDVSVLFKITNEQYKKIYDYCKSKPVPKYHIVKFNCATFVITALNKAKVKHRFKKKAWSLGIFRLVLGWANLCYYGYTPAQMGYDVARGKY